MADRRRTLRAALGLGIAFGALASACTGGSVPVLPSGSSPSEAASPAALAWRAEFDSSLSAPAVAGRFVYVADAQDLIALPVDCTDPCSPAWVGTIPVGTSAILYNTDFTGTAMSNHAPVIADGRIYLVTERPTGIVAFATACGGTTCQPLWSAQVVGAMSEPIVVGGAVIVASSAGRVYSFPASCGAGEGDCLPRWTMTLPGSVRKPGFALQLVYADGSIYLASSDRLYSIDAASGRLNWWGGPGPGGASNEDTSPAPPAIFQGSVYATLWRSHTNVARLFAFPTRCRGDGGRCGPTWSAGTRDDFLGWPALAEGSLYVGTETTPGSGDGMLAAYSPTCETADCPPNWSVRVPSELVIGWFAVENHVLYAISREQGDAYAYPTSCSDACQPLWRTDSMSSSTVDVERTTSTGPYGPTFVDGKVVFTTSGGSVRVFDPTNCPSDGTVCAPSMSWDAGAGALTEVATDGNLVFAGSRNGVIFAFRM